MSGFAFDRIYYLQVIDKGETVGVTTTLNPDQFISGALSSFIDATTGNILSPQQQDFNKTSTDLSIAEITTNRIEAKIKFSGVSSVASSDTHTIKIYNLDRKTISFMRKSGVKVVLRAGYAEQYPNTHPSRFPEVFKGEIITSKVLREGNSTATVLTLSSAVTERKKAIVSESFSSSESLLGVVETISKKMGIPYIINLGDKASITLGKHRSWSGPVLDVLDRIALEYDFRVYIVNEILTIDEFSSPILDNTKKVSVIEIRNDAIKGSVSLSTDHTKTLTTDEVKEVEFTTLLEPRITVGSIVRLTVEGNTSDFKVETVVHKLDTHGPTWDTMVSAKGIRVKSNS